MPIREEFEIVTDRSRQLLEDMIALNAQEFAPETISEWVQQAEAMLRRTSKIMAEPDFAEIKLTPQVHQYRSELMRLKARLESGQEFLVAHRKAIQTERTRLKRVGALTKTLRAVQ